MRTFAQKQNQPQKPVSSSVARSHTATPGLHHRADLILHLQRPIGNQAVQRMLQTHAEELNAGLAGTASPRFGHNFSRIPILPPAAGAIQTKLAINKPGDEYEQEADRVAEQVMRMPEPQLQHATDKAIQRGTMLRDDPSDDSHQQGQATLGDRTISANVNTDAPGSDYLPELLNTSPEPSASGLAWGGAEGAVPAPAVGALPVGQSSYTTMPNPGAPSRGKPKGLPIVAGLHYRVDRHHGGVAIPLDAFGVTASLANLSNTHFSELFGMYIVNGQLDHSIFWDVRQGMGPLNQIDIESELDSDINAGNYRKVAWDLNPNGRGAPPREKFWAEDLTKHHELFHAVRHVGYYKEGLKLALDWLNSRTATSLVDVEKLFSKAMKRLDEYTSLKTSDSKEEDDAYEAGASQYRARSEAILRRGREGTYPPQ